MTLVLAPELAAALRAARDVELAADGGLSRMRAAVQATSRLMLAAVDAGWPINLMARELGIHDNAARARVAAARKADDGHDLGIDVPPAPEVLDRTVPLDQRVWLTGGEARTYAGLSPRGLANWREYGLLPNTDVHVPTRLLYLRADLDRVMRTRRYPGGPVDRVALLEQIRASPV